MRLLACMLITLAAHAESGGSQVEVQVRGLKQDVLRYSAAQPAEAAVLFLPGDGGWRGLAIQMAQSLARSGYDVYGWDVREYLSGFTSKQGPLTEQEIKSDTLAMLNHLAKSRYKRLVLAGWSQGAAMIALASTDPGVRERIAGAVAVGLPEYGLRGWRFADNLSLVTRKEPNEPKFYTEPLLSHLDGLPFAMIQSSADEYIKPESARRLFEQAGEPKRLDVVKAENHRYDGNRDQLFRVLAEQVKWILSLVAKT